MAQTSDPDPYDRIFARAVERAQHAAEASRTLDEQAQEFLAQGGDVWSRACEPSVPYALLARALELELGRAWETRFAPARQHLPQMLVIRRRAAYFHARRPGSQIAQTWFAAAAMTANAHRIAGDYERAERILARLWSVASVGTDPYDHRHEVFRLQRAARLYQFQATLALERNDWERALSFVNREIVKRRLNANEDIGQAYAKRAMIRADLAFGTPEPDVRRRLYQLARADVARSIEAGTDSLSAAASSYSCAFWLARDGEVDAAERLLDKLEAEHAPPPPTISSRGMWARGLIEAARGNLRAGDEALDACYRTLLQVGRLPDAGIVALDRVRLRLEARQPLGILRLVMQARLDLGGARLTDETAHTLAVIWAAALGSARKGFRGAESVAAQIKAAQLALIREN